MKTFHAIYDVCLMGDAMMYVMHMMWTSCTSSTTSIRYNMMYDMYIEKNMYHVFRKYSLGMAPSQKQRPFSLFPFSGSGFPN